MKNKLKKFLKNFYDLIMFFLVVAFVVSCTMILFLEGIDIPGEVLIKNARYTFINVIFITFMIWCLDFLRRKLTVEKYVKNINKGLSEIMKGNFSTEIEKINSFVSENQFNDIIENINLMTKELSTVETLRTDFISNVSHEFKTPLTIIQNYATLLSDVSISEEEQKEYAEKISETSFDLGRLITNILKLNKLENQKIFFKKNRVNIVEQLSTSILLFEDVLSEKNIEIETNIEDEIYIMGDYELLNIVWNNLFSNAIKFSKFGGKIKINIKELKEQIIVEIEDNGIGMDSDTGKRIFEKFYQGNTSHSQKGNGLGLALVFKIINILNGEINVKSKLGEGSVFAIVLWKN